jgi:hypothetical protein
VHRSFTGILVDSVIQWRVSARIVGLDIETSDMGGEASYITLVSATGTAIIIEED